MLFAFVDNNGDDIGRQDMFMAHPAGAVDVNGWQWLSLLWTAVEAGTKGAGARWTSHAST